jgi:hypothetical protein
MSQIPSLLRQLANEIEQQENFHDNEFITINTRLNDQEKINETNNQKIKEVANAFATFANILGRED